MSKTKKVKSRDFNILAGFKREVSLATRVVRDKKKYNRKIKHKNKLDF